MVFEWFYVSTGSRHVHAETDHSHREIVLFVDLEPGDTAAWKRFQDELRSLIDKYGNELAIAASGFDIPETIDGSVVSESGIRELGSVPRPETEAQ